MFHLIAAVGGPTYDPSPAVIDRIESATAADPASAVAAVVLTVLALLLVVGALTTWLLLRANRKARIAALSPAERERRDAVAEYRARLSAAEKGLTAATKERTHRLKSCEKALAQAHAAAGRPIASYRGRDCGASVTPLYLEVPQGRFALTPAVTATVDTAGNLATSSRSTLTRIAAGGLLFGPVGAIIGGVAKKTRVHDTRELYLLMQGDTFATLITCAPDDGQRVRHFAAVVRQAALNSDAARAYQAQAVAYAEQALALEQQNVGAVDAARHSLEAATADTARMDAAAAALAQQQPPTAGRPTAG